MSDWAACSRTERWLKSLTDHLKDAGFRLVKTVDYERVTPSWRKVNPGRSKAKVEGAVVNYGERMENGSPAPAVILWEYSKSDWLDVLDGVQRMLAGELRENKTFWAYILKTDNVSLAKEIRCFANHNLQGDWQESQKFTMRNAIEQLVINPAGEPSTLERIAKLGHWKLQDVVATYVAIEWGQAVEAINGPSDLAMNMLNAIAAVAQLKDLEIAPEPIATFLTELHTGKFNKEAAVPFIESFWEVNRKKPLYPQFAKNLLKVQKDPEYDMRVCGPRKGPRTQADINCISKLKAARTAIVNARKQRAQFLFLDECYGLTKEINAELDLLRGVQGRPPRGKK